MNAIVPQGNNPLVFNFHGNPIRIVQDEDGEPLFVAVDVCKALEHSNPSVALQALPDDEKSLSKVYNETKPLLVVTESGLYRLIFRSNKKEAEELRLFVFREVLPQIRKTGMYIRDDLSPMQILRQMFAALDRQEARLDDHAERITSLESHVQTDVEYYTVMGYFRKRGLPAPSLNQAQSIGQRATKLSRAWSYGIGKTSDPRFGEVNTYHVTVLDEIADNL